MKDDYTHISIILDRTGSMQVIRDDTIGGFNTFLKDQKEQHRHCHFDFVQFDTVESLRSHSQFQASSGSS